MLDIAVSLCKNVIDFVVMKNNVDNAKKNSITECLNEISDVLIDTANSLEQNIYPHMNCAIMHSLSKKLLVILSDYISEEDAVRLTQVMNEASEVEKQFSLREEPDTIPKIYRAAGEFKAMALLANL